MRKEAMTDARIVDTLWQLLDARSPAASICPSEIARAMAPDGEAWRALMPQVRQVAAALAAQGAVEVTRGGRVVDALAGGGPVRIRRPTKRSP